MNKNIILKYKIVNMELGNHGMENYPERIMEDCNGIKLNWSTLYSIARVSLASFNMINISGRILNAIVCRF